MARIGDALNLIICLLYYFGTVYNLPMAHVQRYLRIAYQPPLRLMYGEPLTAKPFFARGDNSLTVSLLLIKSRLMTDADILSIWCWVVSIIVGDAS